MPTMSSGPRVARVIRFPLTYVPLALPLSTSSHWLPVRRKTAWRRDTSRSLRTTLFSGARPIVTTNWSMECTAVGGRATVVAPLGTGAGGRGAGGRGAGGRGAGARVVLVAAVAAAGRRHAAGVGAGGLDGRNELQRLPGRRRAHQHVMG